MSWITVLNDTFDACSSIVGKKIDGHMLLPVGCTTAMVQIEVVISEEGNFLFAHRLPKEESNTVFFATEKSSTRTANAAPMPWHDKLPFVAGDYDLLVPGILEEQAKEKNKTYKPDKPKKDHHKAYMEQLKRWMESPYSDPMIKSLYTYLDKDCLIADLVEAGVFEEPDEFVRFRIVPDIYTPSGDIWETQDIKLLNNFQNWYMDELKNDPETRIGICYATGKRTVITKNHPKKIRHAGDGAKLISSNDDRNFTFRGRRFEYASDAVQISYEASQKAHNTLRWLIEKQGKRFDSARTVCWSFGDTKLPDWTGDTASLLDYDEEKKLPDTAEKVAIEINKAMSGYYTNLDDTARIYIMSVDTADGQDKGRLAITYFSDLSKNEFFQNLKNWHLEGMWSHEQFWKGLRYTFYGAPSAYALIRDAFGIEQKGTDGKSGRLEVDDNKVKRTMERLLPCITEGRSFPKDIKLAIVKNASEPQRYSPNNHKKLIEDACSVIQRCRVDDGKERINMGLQEDLMDRDYLFGRLLAVINRAETIVNYKKDNANRETNTYRLWTRFVRKPAMTFAVLQKRLIPYMHDLGSWQRERFSKMIEDIINKLDEIDGFNNEPLKENYLLGYYSQTDALRSTKEKEMDEDEEYTDSEQV